MTKLIAAAVVLGIVAGAALIALRADGEQPVAAANTCPAGGALAEIVRAKATGAVAAIAAADRAISLADLAFAGPDGQAMTLADRAGKVVLLNLWATWCAPCREEMPDLDRLQAELGGDDFEVVALNLDRGEDDKPQAFFAEVGLRSLVHYRDGTLRAFNRMRADGLLIGLPATYLVDRQGCVSGILNGPAKWDAPDAKAMIEAAIAAQ